MGVLQSFQYAFCFLLLSYQNALSSHSFFCKIKTEEKNHEKNNTLCFMEDCQRYAYLRSAPFPTHDEYVWTQKLHVWTVPYDHSKIYSFQNGNLREWQNGMLIKFFFMFRQETHSNHLAWIRLSSHGALQNLDNYISSCHRKTMFDIRSNANYIKYIYKIETVK